MKKFLLSMSLMVVGLTALADYNSMEFKTTDGMAKSIATQGLTIIVSGENLVISNSKGESLSFPALSLASMQFVDDSGGIEGLIVDNGPLKAFSYEGLYQGEFNSIDEAKNNLLKGVYVLKSSNGGTVKIVVE